MQLTLVLAWGLSEVLGSHQYVYVPLHKEICMLLVLTNQLQFQFNLSKREIKLCDSKSPSHCPSTISKRSRFLNALFCQVVSDIKSHALYLTIHLNSNASRECLGSVGKIEVFYIILNLLISCKDCGDIFVHAKCNDHGMLFDLAKSIIQNMPRGCVDKFEDIYGWTYRDGRDLSEFVD
ncbi:uncharacterized protein DC041_0012707, partial [Schistosoma bovis]